MSSRSDSSVRKNEAPNSDELAAAAASGGSGSEGMKHPSSDGLAGASRLSDRKGKRACVVEEVKEDMQEGDGPPGASRGGRGMAKRASVLEEEELKIRAEKSIACKEIEPPSDIEVEKKFAYDDEVEPEDVSAPADKDLSRPQFDDISEKPNYIVFKELDSKTVISGIEKILTLNAKTVAEGKGFSYDIPERGAMMMAFHEARQQLVIKRGGTLVRKFSRNYLCIGVATTLVFDTILKTLKEGVTITNHDLFCRNKEVYGKIEVSDGILYDVCCMLGCTMSSLNVVSVAKSSVIGPLTLRLKNGYAVNCSEKSFGGVRIPNNALEAEIGIGKHEVDFILVLEKSSMFHHLCHMDFHTENKCIMITGDGEPDVATRAFLKMLVDVTQLKTYALVDPDAHGVQTLCTYAFGSTVMADDWLGLEVPSIHWLEIFPRDLASMTEAGCSNISDFSEKEQRILKGLVKRRRKVLPKPWIKRIKELASENTKASLESLYSLGFGYLSKVFIPKLLGKEERNLTRC